MTSLFVLTYVKEHIRQLRLSLGGADDSVFARGDLPCIHSARKSPLSRRSFNYRFQSMIPKSGFRFSEKIMLKEHAKAK